VTRFYSRLVIQLSRSSNHLAGQTFRKQLFVGSLNFGHALPLIRAVADAAAVGFLGKPRTALCTVSRSNSLSRLQISAQKRPLCGREVIVARPHKDAGSSSVFL